MATGNATSSAGYLDPCLMCRKQCGSPYWALRRVRGHFCSKECATAFASTHALPKPPKPRCWQCNEEFTNGFRHRQYRGSKFCSRECLRKFADGMERNPQEYAASLLALGDANAPTNAEENGGAA
jgi:YHS domain-containing protein